MMRAVAGLLVAAALLALFVTSLQGSIYDLGGFVQDWLLPQFILSLAVLLILGAPLYVLFQQRGIAGFMTYLAPGWCVGIFPWLVVRALEFPRIGKPAWHAFVVRDAPYFDLWNYVVHGASGVLAALVFLVLVRPDIRRIRL